MTAVPKKIWPMSVHLIDLPAYAYGGILVGKCTQEGNEAVTIRPGAPGCIHLAQYQNGPKDWSPNGIVPKEWTFITKLPHHQTVRLIFSYVNIEGNTHRIEQSIMTTKTLEALYFVPM